MTLRLTLRNDVWQVSGTVVTPTGGRLRVRKSTGFGRSMKPHAQEAMGRILKDALDGRLEKGATSSVSVGQAIRLFLDRPSKVGETDVNIMGRFDAAHGKTRLEALTVADVMLWVNSRGNKASTVKREINSIMAMLNHAKDMGLDAPDLRLKKPKVDDSRTRWLDEDERDTLIECCEPEIEGLVTFLFFTGARLGEAFRVEWSDIIDGKATFGTRKGTSGKTRFRAVPLVDDVTKAMGRRGTGLVFPNPAGGQWHRDGFYDYFYRATRRAAIEDFRPHDMRHTFASLLVQRGASLRAVADLLGHSSLSMVMRYSHLAPSHLEDTIGLLGVRGT
jgi:integrase